MPPPDKTRIDYLSFEYVKYLRWEESDFSSIGTEIVHEELMLLGINRYYEIVDWCWRTKRKPRPGV